MRTMRTMGCLGLAGVLATTGLLLSGASARDTDRASESSTAHNPWLAQGCRWRFKEAGKSLLFKSDKKAVHLPMVSDEPANPVFAGDVDGEPITVTLWKGTSTRDAERDIAEMKEEWDELLAASLEGATDPGSGDDVETEVVTPDAADIMKFEKSLVTVAFLVESGGVLEYGAPDAKVFLESTGKKRRSARECLTARAGRAHEVTAKSESGLFNFARSSSDKNGVASRLAPPTTTVVRYRTFIPEAKVGSPCGTFKGDDRGFSAYYDRPNRSRASVFFNWADGTVSLTKRVGTTHKLDDDGNIEAAKTASTAGIKFYDPNLSGSALGRVRINHAVGNPLCTILGVNVAGPIYYAVIVNAWKDRSTWIQGELKLVPNHEAHVYPKSQAFGSTIFTREHVAFSCLKLPCGNSTISATYP